MIKQKAWAVLMAGIIALGAGAINTNAFATTEESTAGQEQMQATSNTELPGLSSDGTGNDQSNVSITNSNITVEEQPTEQQAVPPEEQVGNAILSPEQVLDVNHDLTADCFRQLDEIFGEIWWNGVLISISGEDTTDTGDIAEAISNATENISSAVGDDLGQEGQDALNDIGGEVAQNITNEADNAGIDLSDNATNAIEEASNGTSIIDQEAGDALIDKIEENTGASGEISDIIGGAIGDVISGDLNASEAADSVANDLTELGNSSDITVDDINNAASEVNVTEISDDLQDAINTNDSSGEIADSIIDGATEDVAEEGGQTIDAGTESGDRNLVARIDNTISELQSIREAIAGATG